MPSDIITMINQSRKPTVDVHSVSFRLDTEEEERLDTVVEENEVDKTIFLRNAVMRAMDEYDAAKRAEDEGNRATTEASAKAKAPKE